MAEFIGRERELLELVAEFNMDKPSLVIVYGRRRVGKSTLLQKAASSQPTFIYFQATRLEERMNLDDFKVEVARVLGPDEILNGLRDWTSVLHWLARAAEKNRGLIVILDEFPNLSDDQNALPSVIQKFWDSGKMKPGNLKLVLCGSVISHMEELLAERNPLYGRRTMALELGAMPLREAAQFLPTYSAEDKIVAYSVVGGIPYYLETFDQNISLEENIVCNLMSPAGPLFNETDYLLQSEVRETRRYSSIVEAIATGATKTSEVVARAGLHDAAQLTPYIDRLVRMRILEKRRPFDTSPKARDARYAIADPIFRFFHRFVRPNLSSLARRFGESVFDRVVRPQLSNYMGSAFEDVCREHLRLHAQERMSAPAHEIGKIWSGDYDLDVVGKLLDSSWVFGECKWESHELGESVLSDLKRNAGIAIKEAADASTRYMLFSRKGFAPRLRRIAETDDKVILYGLDELVDARMCG